MWQKFVKCDTPSGSCAKVEVVIPRTSPNKLHFAQNGRQRCTSDKEDAIYYYFKKQFAYDETLAFWINTMVFKWGIKEYGLKRRNGN